MDEMFTTAPRAFASGARSACANSNGATVLMDKNRSHLAWLNVSNECATSP